MNTAWTSWVTQADCGNTCRFAILGLLGVRRHRDLADSLLLRRWGLLAERDEEIDGLTLRISAESVGK